MDHSQSLLYLVLIIAAAKVGGEIAERLRQPSVLGELLAGVVMGACGLRHFASDPTIGLIATVGIILLLFEAGLESEADELAGAGRSATLVALIGVVLPFVAGFLAMYAMGGDYKLGLFIGATLTATSVGITARVLIDAGKINSKEAKIVLGAAVVDDIIGLVLLSLVLQITTAGKADVFGLSKAVVIALAFLVTATLVGIKYASRLTPLAQKLKTRGVLVTLAFLFCMAMAMVSKQLGLAEIIGAFAAGLVLATTEDRVKIHSQIKPVTDIFVPVFFVLVGLQMNLAALNPFGPNHSAALLVGLVLFVLAVVTKLVSGLGVLDKKVNRYAVGVGMVPRGEVVLIFASIGLAKNILNADNYAALILVVFLSTLVAPWWLRRVLVGSR